MRLPSSFIAFRPFLRSIVLLASTATCVACNEAPLRAAPDAGNPCVAPQLEAPCKAQDAGVPGCGADLNSLAALTQEVVLPDASYPVGCTVFVTSPVPDEDNQCTQLGSCNCASDDGGAPYQWVCVQ